jgi:hypothetical protein
MKSISKVTLLFILLSCQNLHNPVESISNKEDTAAVPVLPSAWIDAEIKGVELSVSPYKHVDSAIYSEISTPLANSVLKEYLTPNTKDSLEMYFDRFANDKWGSIERLNDIDALPFEAEFFNEGIFTSKIERTITVDDFTLLLLKMNPKSGEPWIGGICPGLGWIIRMNHTNEGYSYAGSTGRFKYSFKYGKSPTSIEMRNKNSTPYLEVRTDAGGVGQGREGIVLYKMEPFGEILFNNIYLTFYSDIRWLPQDTARSMWAFRLLDVDPSQWDGKELHVESKVDLTYNISSDFSEIGIRHSVNTAVFTYSNRITGQVMYSDTIPEFSFRQFYTLSKD